MYNAKLKRCLVGGETETELGRRITHDPSCAERREK
jgi:hypothetical protein